MEMLTELWAIYRDDQQLLYAWIMTKTCAYPTCVVSAWLVDGPHSQNINGRASPSLRWDLHFQVCWHSLSAPPFPDLSICDYFLWGYFKVRVYAHKPCTLDNLKEAIPVECCSNWQSIAGESGGQLPRTPSEMRQWKRTPHEGYCFPNIYMSNVD